VNFAQYSVRPSIKGIRTQTVMKGDVLMNGIISNQACVSHVVELLTQLQEQ